MSQRPISVLYIAGIPRSGSTLLSRILGQIEGFVSVGELHHVWQTGAPLLSRHELCGCGSNYRDCDFWPRVMRTALGEIDSNGLDEIAALKRETDRVRYIPMMLSPMRTPDYRCRFQQYRPLVKSLYSAIQDVCQPRVIVDATKDPSSLFLLSSLPDLKVTVLHLVRDPRGVAHSWAKKMLRPEFSEQTIYMPRQSAFRNAVYWSYSNLLASLSQRLHPRYFLLRYEDFIRRPADWLEKICGTLEEAPPDLHFLSNGRVSLVKPSHILKGNPSRFSSGPIELRLDEEWRTSLSTAQKLTVTLITGFLLLRYGYSQSESNSNVSS